MDKKSKEEIDHSYYAKKISSKQNIGELSVIIREFFKKKFSLKYEYTIDELKDIIRKKHIFPEMQSKIAYLCDALEVAEYSPKKPTPPEIKKIKKLILDIIGTNHIKKNEKKLSLLSLIRKPRKQVIQRTKALAKPPALVNDKESKEIQKFIHASKKAGLKDAQIKKDLREMGFNKDKIDKLVR